MAHVPLLVPHGGGVDINGWGLATASWEVLLALIMVLGQLTVAGDPRRSSGTGCPMYAVLFLFKNIFSES